MYWDSDIAKWIETASYTLATHPDPALDALIDDVVARIAKAQEPDGYFNSFFQRREPAKKWSNLRDWHELYCLGHLIEAAVAHNQATGKRTCSTSCAATSTYVGDAVRAERGPEARLLRPRGDRAGAGQALPADRRAALPRSRQLLHRRARPAAALLRQRGAGARRRSGRLLVHDLPLQPEPRAGARAGPRRRSRRARHVPLLRHGRPRGREGRRRPARGLPAPVGATSTASASTSPAGSARRSTTRVSPPTTTCPTRPPMPRPAPRSGWCSGRTAWRCSRATGATPTSWSRRCTTIR